MSTRSNPEKKLRNKYGYIERGMIYIGALLDSLVELGPEFKAKDIKKPSAIKVDGVRASDSVVSTSPVVVLGDGKFVPPKLGLVERTLTPVTGRLDIVGYKTIVRDIGEDTLKLFQSSGLIKPNWWWVRGGVQDEAPALASLLAIEDEDLRRGMIQSWQERLPLFASIAHDFYSAARDESLNPAIAERLNQ